MATIPAPRAHGTSGSLAARLKDNPAYQAFWLLRTGFTVAPILFGLDKFTHLLVNWDRYLAPRVDDLLPGTARFWAAARRVDPGDGAHRNFSEQVWGVSDEHRQLSIFVVLAFTDWGVLAYVLTGLVFAALLLASAITNRRRRATRR